MIKNIAYDNNCFMHFIFHFKVPVCNIYVCLSSKNTQSYSKFKIYILIQRIDGVIHCVWMNILWWITCISVQQLTIVSAILYDYSITPMDLSSNMYHTLINYHPVHSDFIFYINNKFVQKRCNSSAYALELHLICTNLVIHYDILVMNVS